MLGDIYFLFAPVADFEPVERRWAEIWWPVRLNGSSYICVHGSRLMLPARFTPSNLPTVPDLLEVLRKTPDRFWMAAGNATLELSFYFSLSKDGLFLSGRTMVIVYVPFVPIWETNLPLSAGNSVNTVTPDRIQFPSLNLYYC